MSQTVTILFHHRGNRLKYWIEYICRDVFANDSLGLGHFDQLFFSARDVLANISVYEIHEGTNFGFIFIQ